MLFHSWLPNLRSAVAPRRGRRKPRRRGLLESAMHRLRLETLEDRCLLSLTPGAVLPLPVGMFPVDMATGDFNNDGRIDLATADYGGTVNMILGNGDGTFQPARSQYVPLLNSFAAGDFNADGNLDLALAIDTDYDPDGNPLGILLGNGDGTFADAVFSNGPDFSLTSIATDDLNSDGKLDLVVTSGSVWSEDVYLEVLMGDGDGNFTSTASYGPYSAGLSEPALADFDSDGNADVVVVDGNTRSVMVFSSNGDGTLSAPSSVATDLSAGSVLVGDFNGDGKTDLLTSNPSDGSGNTLLGNGDGTFQTVQSSAAVGWGVAAEVNGDGVLDLVSYTGTDVSVSLGKGDGSFALPITTAEGSPDGTFAVADFNADGRSDAAVAYGDWMDVQHVLVLMNDGIWPDVNMPQVQIDDVTVIEGNSGTTDAVFTVTLSEPYSDTVTVAYATADGTAVEGADYTSTSGTLTFAAGETSKTISVPIIGDTIDEYDEQFFLNLSNADARQITDSQAVGTIQDDDDAPLLSFSPLTSYAVNEIPDHLVTADFNGDGDVDLATANLDATVSVLLGNGDGTFQGPLNSAGSPSASSPYMTAGDFNGDGRIDLATAGWGTSGTADISILRGNGDGTFAGPITINAPPHPGDIATGDLDADGSLDLVVTSWEYDSSYHVYGYLSVLRGHGDGTFEPATMYGPYDGTYLSTPVLADFNGDGITDVAVGQSGTNSVKVFRGNGDATLQEPSDFASDVYGVSMAIGDFNADGNLDLATASYGTVSVLLGDGNGASQTKQSFAAADRPTSVTASDVNGDGMLDLVESDSGGTLKFLLGHGDGSFAPPITTDAGTTPYDVVVADFNHDSRPDAAVVNVDIFLAFTPDVNTVSVLLNEGVSTPNVPTFSIGDVTVTEGNTGTTDAVFTVTLSEPYSDAVTVDYTTADGTALAGSDFVATSGTLTFAPGETSQTIAVPVLGDTDFEPDEDFVVNLTSAAGATIADGQGLGTIVNDDAPLPTLSIGDVTKFEGNRGKTSFTFTVTLSAPSTETVTVQYATADGTATVSDRDYTAKSGTLTFRPGQTSKTITVAVRGDKKSELDETFLVNLFSAQGASIADGLGVGTILNDDGGGSGGKRNSFASAVDAAIEDWMLYGV